jgi:hypothetical protein
LAQNPVGAHPYSTVVPAFTVPPRSGILLRPPARGAHGSRRPEEGALALGRPLPRRRRQEERHACALERAPLGGGQRAARQRDRPVPRHDRPGPGRGHRRWLRRRARTRAARAHQGDARRPTADHDDRWRPDHHQVSRVSTALHTPWRSRIRVPATTQGRPRRATSEPLGRPHRPPLRAHLLLDLDRRDTRPRQQRALRVVWRSRPHGDHRRPPPLQDGGDRRRLERDGHDADPAQGGLRAPPPGRRRAKRADAMPRARLDRRSPSPRAGPTPSSTSPACASA